MKGISPFPREQKGDKSVYILIPIFLTLITPLLMMMFSLQSQPLFLNGIESAPNIVLALLQAYRSWYALMIAGCIVGCILGLIFMAICVVAAIRLSLQSELASMNLLAVKLFPIIMLGVCIFPLFFLYSEGIFTLWQQVNADIRQIKNGTLEQATLTALTLGSPYVFYGPYVPDTPKFLAMSSFQHIESPAQEVLSVPIAFQFVPNDRQEQYHVSYTSNFKIVTEITSLGTAAAVS